MSGVLPVDAQAEDAVLGAVLVDERAAEFVVPEHFHDARKRVIAEAMRELADVRTPIDSVLLVDRLKTRGDLERAGGLAEIVRLSTCVPSAANAPHYAEVVAKAWRGRALIESSQRAIREVNEGADPTDVIAAHESALIGLRPKTKGTGLEHISKAAGSAFSRLERLSERKSMITGLSTGIDRIDDMTAGLQRTDLIIVAGRPSMGKTAFAVGIGVHAALRQGARVAIFSLEMSREQLALRMFASEGHIEGSRLRVGHLYESDWPRIARVAGELSESQFYVDDTGSATLGHIERECAKLALDGAIDLIEVDYLQLMGKSMESMSEEQAIAHNSRGLKALAKAHNCPVVALSQLNRGLESRQDKRPINSDLRGSGGIEQDADVIMFVYRDVVYNPDTDKPNVAEVIIGKQRNGPLGTAECAFLGEYTRFENLAADDAAVWKNRE